MKQLLVGIFALVTSLAYAGGNNTDGDSCRGNCPNGGEGSEATANPKANANAFSASASKAKLSSQIGDIRTHIRDGDTTIEGAKVSTGDVIVAGDAGDTTSFDAGDYSYDYQIPAHADAGTALMMLQGCYGIGGADARGSDGRGAGGLTLNIFKLTNDRCVLAARAAEAQANGNLKGYVTMTCADRAVWRSYRRVIGALEDRKVTKAEAIKSCVAEMIQTQLTLQDRITKVEAVQNVYMDSDLEPRVKRLEGAAHRPRTTTLLMEEKHD